MDQQQLQQELEEIKKRNAELEAESAKLKATPFFAEETAKPADRKYPSWTFACPGPGLKDWNEAGRPGLLKDGPLVAVNSAIGVIEDADVWLVTRLDLDLVLRDFGMTIDEVIESEVAIWANKSSWKRVFIDTKRDTGGLRKYYPNRKPAMESMLDFPTRTEWSEAPVLGGVAIAVSMGAKHVRVFGNDMKGSGYAGIPAGPFAYRLDEDAKHAARWQRERRVMDMATLDCADGGVLLQLGDQVADKPKRTAPRVAKRTKKADQAETVMPGADAAILGNPTMRPAAQSAQEKHAIRAAEQKIQREAAAQAAK